VYPVQIYHKDMAFPVGQVTYGWDDSKDEATMEADFTRENVMKIMESQGWNDSRLYRLLKEGKPIPVSSEYNCDIERHNGTLFQRNFRDMSLALVDQGNCPDMLCNLKLKGDE
jgi:hypothetical protein